MKLTIERASLLKSLAHVQSVVERRNTIPILSNVLLEAGSENLRLSATDMDLSVVEGVSAQVEQTGATTAPAHTLYDIVRKLPEGAEVSFEVSGDNGRMTLAAGRSNFTLTTLPKEDFPAVGDGVLPQNFAMAASELKKLSQRHLSARHQDRRSAGTQGRGDRRTPPCPLRDAAAGRGRGHAGRHRAAQDGGRTAQADR
jgi:DNA polymerase-3 subunit beta